MMAFMAYELALNSDIQNKLRTEVEETYQECNGKLTYELLMRMKFMDMVVSGRYFRRVVFEFNKSKPVSDEE